MLCDIDGVLRFFDQHEVTRLEHAAGLGMTGLLHREPEDLRRALARLFDGPRAPWPVDRRPGLGPRASGLGRPAG
ncbi:hypothetical protein ACFWA9_04165 [Kitasatospora sp. NPDC059973]|uniref:hypothetical protein n=1 Tax=Kitasatospora sp. NPDC059973 TaxID=3347020 RepID=UPI0036897C20